MTSTTANDLQASTRFVNSVSNEGNNVHRRRRRQYNVEGVRQKRNLFEFMAATGKERVAENVAFTLSLLPPSLASVAFYTEFLTLLASAIDARMYQI